MTVQVDFHTGVGDDVAFAARLLRKAYGQGARVLVRGASARLALLDRMLWTQAERDFVPHLRWSAGVPPKNAARTPIWIVDGDVPEGAPPVLVNLGAELPGDVERFTRVIEIVADDAEATALGRARWREYRARSLPVQHHAHGSGEG